MREYILTDNENVYRVFNNNQLSLSHAINGNIIYNTQLTTHNADLFSCDIDKDGEIHIAAVIMGTLTYIRYSHKKTNTVNLMRLPDKFSITSLCVNSEDDVRLNYCVKSKEGCAIIEYTKKGDNWQGKNIYTTNCLMQILYVKKHKNECFVVKETDKTYTLINAYEPDKIILSANSEIQNLQSVHNGVVFNVNDDVYYNSNEIGKGEKVYSVDAKRILCLNDKSLREYTLGESVRFSGEVNIPRGAREYVLCVSENDKRIILSSPFPYIRTEPERKNSGALLEEIYMQQRSIFVLQGEIKTLKNRIKRLEEDQKRMFNMLK